MNILKNFIIISTAGILFSCGSNQEVRENHDHTHSTVNDVYEMKIVTEPAVPVETHATKFILTPVKAGTDSIVALQIMHEKKIHLIVVTADLSSFRHLHPIEQNDGTYSLSDTFPHGGNYILYADYTPAGSGNQVTMQTIKVNGKEEKSPVYKTQMLQSKTNGYTVELKPVKDSIVSNKEVMLTAEIRDAKGIIAPDKLENYLGQKGHMVIIGVNNKKYLHVHPMLMGNDMWLHTNFPEAGMYRAWLEFKKDGKVNVADFVINVH